MHLECHHNTTNLTLFCFKCAAFYQLLKSKVGLSAVLRIDINIEGCVIVAVPVHAPSRAPLLLPLLCVH
jgi:hypothetical protein